jgi:hypothetical protein
MADDFFEMTFTSPVEWGAKNDAESWLTHQGFSIAPSCASGTRGVMLGKMKIAKWRNLTADERARLHGRLDGDTRRGPLRLVLTNAFAIEAARKTPGETEIAAPEGFAAPDADAQAVATSHLLPGRVEVLAESPRAFLRSASGRYAYLAAKDGVATMIQSAMESPEELSQWAADAIADGFTLHYLPIEVARTLLFEPFPPGAKA